MDWRWLWLFQLSQMLTLNKAENFDIVIQLNTKRLINYVPERFLSMTLDPSTLFLAGNLEQNSLKMARGLYPSFVRLGGRATNSLKFGKEPLVDNSTITEEQWDGVNKFVKEAGLDLIVSLNPTNRLMGVWDSRDALELISYSDMHGYNVAWQLGYDTDGISVSGQEIGRDIVRLRKILDGFQRYSNIPLFGPDIPQIRSPKDSTFVRDMLSQAASAIGAISIQIPFSKKEDTGLAVTNSLLNMDNYVWNRDLRFGRGIPKKPLWLAEKHPSNGSKEDAISLVKHLGVAAKIGCQIVLRNVGFISLKHPTPDFWLTLLYKNLVGRGVFDIKLNPGNKSEIAIFSHCSQSLSQEKSILDTGFNYDKGSVTLFGANESPESVKISLKASMKDDKVHLYYLTFQQDPVDKKVQTLFNGQVLSLSPTSDLPIISPKVKRTIKYGINIPGDSIFFIVIPDGKAKTCIAHSPVVNTDIQTISKKLIQAASEVLDKPLKEYHIDEEEEDQNKTYVKFTKSKPIQNKQYENLKNPLNVNDSEPDVQVKYITFNDNSWLNKLTETLGNNKFDENNYEEKTNRSDSDKYPLLSAAITGSLNLPDSYSESISESAQRRKKRSPADNSSVPPDMDETTNDQNIVASQEDLVKHLNHYASEIYRTSQTESEREIQITNIPPEIFNTLKNVKVTFKNLGEENSIEETQSKKPSQDGRKEEEKEDSTPLNDYQTTAEGTMDPILLEDHQKSRKYHSLNKNEGLDFYNEENLKDNHRVEKDVNNKDRKTLEEIAEKADLSQIKNYEDREIYSETNINEPNEPSPDISDKYLEAVQPGIEQKYTDPENDSEMSIIKEDVDGQFTTEFDFRSEKNLEPSEDYSNQDNIDILSVMPGSEDKKPRDKTKDIFKDMGLEQSPNSDNIIERGANIVMIPAKSMDESFTSDYMLRNNENSPLDDNDQLLDNQELQENKEKSSETNSFQNENNDTEKVINQENKEQDYDKSENNESLKKIFTKENAEENIFNDQQFREITQKSVNEEIETESDPMHEKQMTPLVVPMAPIIVPLKGDGKQTEEDFMTAYNPDTAKVKKEIPAGEDEPIIPQIPLVMVPITQESEMELQEDNINKQNLMDSIMEKEGSDDIDEVPDNIKNEKDISGYGTELEMPKISGIDENLINSVKSSPNNEVASFGNLPIDNTEDKSYLKITNPSVNNNNANNPSPIEDSMIDLEREEEASSQYSTDKKTNYEIQTYPSIPVDIPLSFPMILTAAPISNPSDKEVHPQKSHNSFPKMDSLPLVISSIPEEKSDLPGINELYRTNNKDMGENEEKNISHYKFKNIITPEEEMDINKKTTEQYQKEEISKIEMEKERREKLLHLKRQIAEMREQFRAQLREETIRAALQRREEDMRNHLSYDREIKKKYLAYPMTAHEDNTLSRPRRLSYFPESDLSEEELDYIDSKMYKKRSDSYGMPLPDEYLNQQILPDTKYKPDYKSVIFPLDPKASQAVVYNDRIIPAKFFGIIPVNDNEPSMTSNFRNNQILDLPPTDSVYQKYFTKQDLLRPLKEKYVPKQSEPSSPVDAYSLPRDAYIKSINEQTNYIPVVVLSSPTKNYRQKRSINQDSVKEVSFETSKLRTDQSKKGLESTTHFDDNAFQERSNEIENELPIETTHNLINDNSIQKNLNTQKNNERNHDIIYPEFLPCNNFLFGCKKRPSFQNRLPSQDRIKESMPLLAPNTIAQEPSDKCSNLQKLNIFSTVHRKFKSMLETLHSLADWCSGSTDK